MVPLGHWGLGDFEMERAARGTLDALQRQPASDGADEVRTRRWYSRYTPMRLALGMWGLIWRPVEHFFVREREEKRYGW